MWFHETRCILRLTSSREGALCIGTTALIELKLQCKLNVVRVCTVLVIVKYVSLRIEKTRSGGKDWPSEGFPCPSLRREASCHESLDGVGVKKLWLNDNPIDAEGAEASHPCGVDRMLLDERHLRVVVV